MDTRKWYEVRFYNCEGMACVHHVRAVSLESAERATKRHASESIHVYDSYQID